MACKLIVVSGMAFEARLAGGKDILTVCGLDPASVEHAVERGIKRGASGILSFGTAAGIAPGLRPGSAILGRRIVSKAGLVETDSLWTQQLCVHLPSAQLADIAGIDRPVATIKDKNALCADSGAVIADMESHHVARMAQRYRLPFAAVRVVLDGADRALPPAALAAMRRDGTINYARVLASLLAYPRQIPDVLRLAADARTARKALLHAAARLQHCVVVIPG